MDRRDAMAAGELHERGWRKTAKGTWRHPKLAHPRPRADASRLEAEYDEGDTAALRLLGTDRKRIDLTQGALTRKDG